MVGGQGEDGVHGQFAEGELTEHARAVLVTFRYGEGGGEGSAMWRRRGLRKPRLGLDAAPGSIAGVVSKGGGGGTSGTGRESQSRAHNLDAMSAGETCAQHDAALS
jgi:hypothetical protein